VSDAAAHSVKSAGRVLDIFELLAAEPEGLSVTEISARLSIPRSSAHVLVQTLAERRYVRGEGHGMKRFTLGVPLVQLGLNVTDRLELRTVARHVLKRLVETWHESALLAAADGDDIVYVDKVVSDRFGFRTDPRLNARRPLHSHSLGKALLAATGDDLLASLLAGKRLERVTDFTIVDPDELREELWQTRERGYAIDVQEAVLGVCCVGAPVRDHSGRPVGAVSMSTIREYYRPDETGPAILEAAVEISRAMGWTGDAAEMYPAAPPQAEPLPAAGRDGALASVPT
jgi:DNA-binding IclR family transcriptional regulator